MAYQYLHPNGAYNQDNPQSCGRDCSYHLASQSIWAYPLPDRHTCLKGINKSPVDLNPDFKTDN